MMAFPKNVKSVAVSSVVNPVTQTAEVEVKKASVIEMPFVLAEGSKSKHPPIIMIKIKLDRNKSDGLMPFKKFKLLITNII